MFGKIFFCFKCLNSHGFTVQTASSFGKLLIVQCFLYTVNVEERRFRTD